MRKYAFVSVLLFLAIAGTAKNKHKKDDAPAATPAKPAADSSASKKGAKPYNKVITDKAVTKARIIYCA